MSEFVSTDVASLYLLAMAFLISTSISACVTTWLLCSWLDFRAAFLLTSAEKAHSRMVRIKNTAMPDDRMLTVTMLVPRTVVGVVPVST